MDLMGFIYRNVRYENFSTMTLFCCAC